MEILFFINTVQCLTGGLQAVKENPVPTHKNVIFKISCFKPPAGGYYPGQPEYATSVQPIVMSLNRHLQQSTPPQQLLAHSYSPRRTERKQVASQSTKVNDSTFHIFRTSEEISTDIF